MNELLELAIAAHGGLDRWHSYRTVSLELSVGGALWHLKGQAGLFATARYEADTREQRATLGHFGAPDRHVRFTPDRLVLETDSGEVIESRDSPRTSFAGHVNETHWDQLHAAYFSGQSRFAGAVRKECRAQHAKCKDVLHAGTCRVHRLSGVNAGSGSRHDGVLDVRPAPTSLTGGGASCRFQLNFWCPPITQDRTLLSAFKSERL
jgi:hypothetical protein